MSHNDFTKKLLKLEIGKRIVIKDSKGVYDGEFLRVPSGWVYRHVGRTSVAACFIPYSEDFRYWDMDIDLRACACGSTDIILGLDRKELWEVSCEACGASGGRRKNKIDAINAWNFSK